MSDDKRQGRSCGTCWWFSPSTVRERFHGCGEGWCEFLPPKGITKGVNNIQPTKKSHWCSCWLVNMASDDL